MNDNPNIDELLNTDDYELKGYMLVSDEGLYTTKVDSGLTTVFKYKIFSDKMRVQITGSPEDVREAVRKVNEAFPRKKDKS